MNRIRLTIITFVIICVILLCTACNSKNENSQTNTDDDFLEISDLATQYDFPSDNILKYKGIIIDKDFVIYIFGNNSDLVKTIQRYDDIRIWPERSTPGGTAAEKWKLLNKDVDWYLILYCDTAKMDLDKGFALSNFVGADGITCNYDLPEMITISIKHLDTPTLTIRDRLGDDKTQYYIDGNWSVVDIEPFVIPANN